MKALRQVIELHHKTGFSNRQIATATGVSRPVVADYIAAYDRCGLSWDEFSTLTDSEAVERMTATKGDIDIRMANAVAFFPYMLKELPSVGMTREGLWNECRAETEVTLAMGHKAGDRLYVDFAGAKRIYSDHGVEREAELFVAILGANRRKTSSSGAGTPSSSSVACRQRSPPTA